MRIFSSALNLRRVALRISLATLRAKTSCDFKHPKAYRSIDLDRRDWRGLPTGRLDRKLPKIIKSIEGAVLISGPYRQCKTRGCGSEPYGKPNLERAH